MNKTRKQAIAKLVADGKTPKQAYDLTKKSIVKVADDQTVQTAESLSPPSPAQ